MKLGYADLSFNSIGTPESAAFGDVYFSNDDGLAESDYVFIQGNRLWEQWQTWPSTTFCIGETGFGTGLNFLLTYKRFDAFLTAYPQAPLKKLHYISVEKFPIRRAQLAQIYQQWPFLHHYCASVLMNYPPALEGIHRSHHDSETRPSAVTLDLVLGDASDGLSQCHNIGGGLVNAWYLDGFAPSKNESMWHPNVFAQMARLSSPKASLSSFTAAGAVKRGLQEVGFTVSKISGYGRKREMIVAEFTNKQYQHMANILPPYFQRTRTVKHEVEHHPIPQSIAIVGGGIAGAMLAMRLTEQGIKVSLICKDSAPGQGASGNPIGGFYPQLNAEAGTSSRFYVHAFLYARRFYDALLRQGYDFEHDWCSVLQLGFNQNTQDRLQKMADKSLWPDELASVLSAKQASAIAGVDIPHPALHLPQGGWIAPLSLIHACLSKAQQTGLLNTLYQHQLLSYAPTNAGVSLTLNSNASSQIKLHADKLVIAAGADSVKLCQQYLPMRLTRGQVEAIPSGDTTSKLAVVLCHKGYFTPALDGFHALGSTYLKNDLNTEHRQSEVIKNIKMHKQALPSVNWMDEIEQISLENIHGRAAIRCSTPDHLPLVGAIPDIIRQQSELTDLYKARPLHYYSKGTNVENVYTLTGLGSRGITSAPILVDTLVAQLTNQPFPLSISLLNALMPNRFLVRALIRQTPYPADE